ncbi:hypothetical protein Sgly_0109 [Syntrophobotulus glycolicus DSM 8271]|uniref:ABC-2 family transporter protein n=1 Tax=Syntrophobotulus glycolicus (strain DSM 8271 / FlGlyR) TaxID=645991 RepID=F0SVK4_SYNGF|nr:hypothetical protein [Syntrophobotulus glycolicus]ADY54480.1 hypothetical protein Sgly_0109 [Syntrophobotulus glycolicus DSM 8271]
MPLNIWSFIRKALLGVPLAVFFGIYYTNLMEVYGNKTLEELLLLSYASLELESMIYIVPVIFWILPQLHLTYLLKDYIPDNLENSAVYVFTRTKKKGRWLLTKIWHLFFYVVIYYFIQFISVAVIGMLEGLSFSHGHIGLFLVLTEFALVCLLNFFYVIFINIGALKIKVIHSYFFTVFINIILVLFAGFLYEFEIQKIFLLKYLPPSQSILAWHSLEGIAGNYPDVFRFTIQNFSIGFSMLYLIGFSIIIILYGNYRLKNMDIF